MEIQLSETRKVTSDQHGFQVRRLHISKGVSTWVAYMFFGSLKAALKAIPDAMLKESNAKGWKECKQVLDTTREEILEAFES